MSDVAKKIVQPIAEEVKTEITSTEDIARSLEIYQYVKALLKHKASDMHLKAGRPALFRIGGKLVAAKSEKLNTKKIREIIFQVMGKRHKELFEKKLQVDFSFEIGSLGRFRANVYQQRGQTSVAIRMIPIQVPVLETLSLPDHLKELILQKNGLFLITGATGVGKSTTMAGIIDYINRNTASHIITIEDPIEFLHEDKMSSISQREVGGDVISMNEAIVGALRQDPDVICIGEIRDHETISAALTAAETGHMVITTVHTHDAKSSIERIIDVFPPEQKDQIRLQLSSCLAAVMSQKLVQKKDRTGFVPVCELLVNSPSIQMLIRTNQIEKIYETMNSSKSYYNMQTFNQALEKMVADGKVTVEEAVAASASPDELAMRLSGFKREEGF